MNWLIWKEFRLQRVALAVGLFLLVVPYSLPAYEVWEYRGANGQLFWNSENWGTAAEFSLILSVLTMAFLGGNAIAGERIDRSAEFQVYQPISRRRIVLSKLLAPLFAAIVVWGINLLVVRSAQNWDPDDLGGFRLLAIAGLCAFGVAWVVSSLQDSPTYAAVSGIVAPIALYSCIPFLNWQTDIRPGVLIVNFTGIALLVGLLSFVGGTWYYLRRVEP